MHNNVVYDEIDEFVINEVFAADINELDGYFNIEDLLIMTVNIRSLQANITQLEILISSLKSKPSIIICTETWTCKQSNLNSIVGYQLYLNEKSVNKSDGVAIFVLKELKHTFSIDKLGPSEILNLDLILCNDKVLRITGLYRCHDYPKKKFINDLHDYLEINKHDEQIFFGDFNIDILKDDIDSINFQTNFLAKCFTPYFNNYTRISPIEGKSCVDNAFVKSSCQITSYKLDYLLTDHLPLFLKINNIVPQKVTMTETKLVNYNVLLKLANETNWLVISEQNDVNVATEMLVTKIKKIVEKATYIKKTNRSKIKKNWVTPALLVSIKKKEALYKKYKKSPENFESKLIYTTYAKKLKQILNEAKIKYEQNYVHKYTNNSKKIWNFVNEKMGRKSNKKKAIDQIYDSENKIMLKNDIEKADYLNIYFTKIAKKLTKNIVTIQNYNRKNLNQNSIFFTPVNDYEIFCIINELELKSGGIDGIHASILKKLASLIVTPLAYIINLMLTQGIYPSHFKKAEIVPVFKAGTKSDPNNYRPISLISNLAKIFEKVIQIRLLDFIDKFKLINIQQFGFCKKKGTNDALAQITSFICKNLDNSHPTAAVFLDLAKAFDTVNHKMLIEKLYDIGIRGLPNILLENYLTERKQIVKINNILSQECTVETGVPQGTILGPLLFIIYINDIFEFQNKKTLILSFADDTVIVCQDEDWYKVHNTLSNVLILINNWLKENYLVLNSKKTVCITFTNYADSQPRIFNLSVNGDLIQRVESTNYLGIIIDNHLRWESQINKIINKTKYLVFVLAKLKKVLSFNALKAVMYGLYYSIATYGVVAWGSANKTTLAPLLKIHEKIIKIVFANNKKEIPLSINSRFKLQATILHFDRLKEIYLNSTSVTRFKSIQLPKVKQEVGKKDTFFVAIETFNKLPNDVKLVDKVQIKKKMKRYLIETNI